MRALSACLTVFLGLSATITLASMVGCSDSTDAGSGGAGGASTAGAGGASAGKGGASAGTGGASAGSGGEAGAVECKADSEACTTCVNTNCFDEAMACLGDNGCKNALFALTGCACAGVKDAMECATDFGNDGGDLAPPFAVCYTDNCVSACQ